MKFFARPPPDAQVENPMSRPATDTDVMALTNMHFEDCKTVLEFMQTKVRPVIERFSKNDHADGTVKGAFLRAQAWLGTFSKLDDPSHFQAAIAGTRTLFEIAIDLALMHHDRTTYPVAKMFAWEESAKMKAAERTRDFYANVGRSRVSFSSTSASSTTSFRLASASFRQIEEERAHWRQNSRSRRKRKGRAREGLALARGTRAPPRDTP